MDVRTSGGGAAGAACPPVARGARQDPGDGLPDGLTALGLDPDDLPDGLVVADETGKVTCFNAAAARITAVP
ncbi:histidine kinase, partial [Streptomyces varsoviensis]